VLKSVVTEKLAMQSTNVRKAFRNLDRDYSGRLDRYEFKRFLENLNIHCTMSKFRPQFSYEMTPKTDFLVDLLSDHTITNGNERRV